jgi:hypothetical protein
MTTASYCLRCRAQVILLMLASIVYSIYNTQVAQAQPTSIQIDTATLNVSFAVGDWVPDQALLLHWIETAAQAVADYYQGFPVNKVNIAITPGNRSGIHGVTYRGQEPLISITLGQNMTAAHLQQDWVLVHEMVHLAFPPVKKRHHWIEEGLATYIEPLVRARAGLLDVTAAWHWLLTGLPKGLPQNGDQGLDNTPTWGRTYWGGALFCMLADVKIRQRSNDRFALIDALRAIVKGGGTYQNSDVWELPRALALGDAATGTTVLQDLYAQMKASPVAVDLPALWAQLGVRLADDAIQFDDKAELAGLRRRLINRPQ